MLGNMKYVIARQGFNVLLLERASNEIIRMKISACWKASVPAQRESMTSCIMDPFVVMCGVTDLYMTYSNSCFSIGMDFTRHFFYSML